MARQLRVLLLLIGLTAAVYAHQIEPDRIPVWDRPLVVGIYPYNADGSPEVDEYLTRLALQDFVAIEHFMTAQARPYGLGLERPFELRLAAPSAAGAPPGPPPPGSMAADLRWSLALRLWRWRLDRQGLAPDILMVANYHSPQMQPEHLHSIGILNMRLAVANLVANEALEGRNQVVLAHELLHTVGANDLYNPVSGLPLFPEGYANALQQQRYPQRQAELMAGRVPLQPGLAREAHGLEEVVIGPVSAREIGWLPPG
ncbi:MAG: hypothetical protein EA418_13155 [Wenzhouxiangellaceae bacterium]|nr:MAG: hypothetical protein EA418_13155 [Wenzhouxiangellaceae bacterium]